MKILNWPGPTFPKSHPVDYEQAYIKAALEGSPNGDSFQTYKSLFGNAPKVGTPYWLVRLAIYSAALEVGFARVGKKFGGVDATFAAAVYPLNENALRSNRVLWHRMYLHDVEPAVFGGRELVS